ncbi:AAA family ATPase [Arthrobacter sp. TWP1-1]|uniref:AAA family ATPase n=1 Tax=Arthrobacter sp. TWP1-1 TaxID=2804568 RepID=UPI003CEE88E1
MRIHRLEIQAFGPFAGREIVDFDHLGSQGLFLLNGSTGAGKTSVLDAIAYALYGRVPGTRQGSQAQFRSHHAAEGVGPEVLCEFSAGGRRLEVRRSPEWMRPLKRGTGTTREQASTQLREKTAEGWEVKSTRNDEAAAEIQELLGMSMAQFTKVVLLAQGDFAAFLRASAEERQTLLQKLFGTDLYQNLEARLGNDSKAAQAEVAAGLSQVMAAERLARSQAAQALAADVQSQEAASAAEGAQEAGSAQDAGDEAEVLETEAVESEAGESLESLEDLSGLELFAVLADKLAAAVDRARGQAESAQRSADSLADEVQKSNDRRNRHDALSLALAEQARLQGLAGDALKWRVDQDQHHAAQILVPVMNQSVKTSAASEKAKRSVEVAAADLDANELAASVLDKPAASAAEAELEALDRELTTRLAAVAAAVPEELRLSNKTAELATGEAELARALAAQKQHTADAAAATVRLAEVAEEQEGLHQGGHNVDHAAQDAKQAEQLVTAIEDHQDQRKIVEELTETQTATRANALDAKEQWLDAFNLRLSQAAGELAAELIDGEPCQVCGSTVHPAPSPLAGSGADLVKTEKATKKAFDSAEALAREAQTQLSEATSALAVLAGRGGEGELAEARAAVELKKAAHRAATDAVATLAALNAESAELRAQLAKAQTGVLEATGKAASLHAGNEALIQELAALDEHLRIVRDGFESLSDRRAALTLAQAPGNALLHAVRQRATAIAASDEAQLALVQAIDGSVFADVPAAQAALLTAAEATGLEARLTHHAKDIAVNTDRLAAPEVVAAQAEVAAKIAPPTIEGLERLAGESAKAKARARQGELVLGLARSAQTQLAATESHFKVLEEAVAPLRARAQLLEGLANAVRGLGDNKLKMTLTSYVLAARLEQVAEAASLRLATMSDARYTLRHSDAKSGNKKSGLGLEVVDEWTGISRDTSTLSGGESFMASLALALGLSDVVQQESGGLDIETLFVDEGFGSLDEQSLEQVMDALEGLRDGGRMVGLVSHVAEMKQRIPMHLHVHKGRNGSTLTVGDSA